LHDLFLLRASRFKSSARACLVFDHARQQPFAKAAAQIDCTFVPRAIVIDRDERSFGRSRIVFGQRARKPGNRSGGDGARSLREDRINRLVERPSVAFPAQLIQVTIRPRFDIVMHDAERLIQCSNGLSVAPQHLITEGDLLQSRKAFRTKLIAPSRA